MAFLPSSTISLCKVDFDNSYKNQVYFSLRTEQNAYFNDRVVKRFSDYLTVRKTLPNGNLQSSVKVGCNIEDLYGCNYMFYQNSNHGLRFFYAFITKLIYINEKTTEIVFETDVYQTWLFDCELLPSYVIREHSATDKKGTNLVPESFNCTDFDFFKFPDNYTDFGDIGYLVASTEDLTGTASRGALHSGVYQGLYFYFLKSAGGVNSLLDSLEEEVEDSVLFIACIPERSVVAYNSNKHGYVSPTTKPSAVSYKFDGYAVNSFSSNGMSYTPKNNKLFSYPYYALTVTNNAGDTVDYMIEDFDNSNAIFFKAYADISANPSISFVPQAYKGFNEAIDFSVSISGFPQCTYNSDTFKLWLAKNQYGNAMNIISGIGEVAGGAVMASTGAGAMVGVGAMLHGVSKVANTANATYQASREPNKANGGSPKNNLLTAMGKNKIDVCIRTIKAEQARTIDDFFTMYGYQCNKVKVPNVSARPYFNYVQTADINISGGIPADDMKRLKEMYDSGATLWRSGAKIGDYSVNNSAYANLYSSNGLRLYSADNYRLNSTE